MADPDLQPLSIEPVPAMRGVKPYSVMTRGNTIDLWLDANEGPELGSRTLRGLDLSSCIRRYPSTESLRGLLAARLGVGADQVAVTAGGDDAIDRACRSVLGPGKEIILTPPTFEMFHRYAALTGATAVSAPWLTERFPLAEVLAKVTPRTAVVAVVSPNNPTGLVATADDLRAIASRAPHALVIADLAYTEFADIDLQAVALEFPNIVSIRTLSKAWGLAGLRVGYAVGDARVINWIRSAGGPYAVSATSARVAAAVIEQRESDMRSYVDRVKVERSRLFALLTELGLDPWPSQANFVTTGARGATAGSPVAGLERRGIAARGWSGRSDLPANAARITCPGDERAFERLCGALREVAAEGWR